MARRAAKPLIRFPKLMRRFDEANGRVFRVKNWDGRAPRRYWLCLRLFPNYAPSEKWGFGDLGPHWSYTVTDLYHHDTERVYRRDFDNVRAELRRRAAQAPVFDSTFANQQAFLDYVGMDSEKLRWAWSDIVRDWGPPRRATA